MVLLVMKRSGRLQLLWDLEVCGARVLMAPDVAEAKCILKTKPVLDVVFTDSSLPDGDWSSVLAAAQTSVPAARLVVCAKATYAACRADFERAGAWAVLVEPYEREQVLELLAQAVSAHAVPAHAVA
jgi:DNA-binding NtrC family response regulator